MKRRDFLKTATALTACALTPVAASRSLANQRILESEPIPVFEYEPLAVEEYGRIFSYACDSSLKERMKIMSFAITDAKATLPAGTVFEIREKISTNYGYDLGIAWYHITGMQRTPLVQYPVGGGVVDLQAGFVLLARIVA